MTALCRAMMMMSVSEGSVLGHDALCYFECEAAAAWVRGKIRLCYCSLTCTGTFRRSCYGYTVPWTSGYEYGSWKLTSFLISHSKFRIQSSFLLRQRWAAMRFLLLRLTSWINSSCSEVNLCIFNNIWKSFRGRFVIWSTGKGSFTWRKTKKSKKSKVNKAIRFTYCGQIYITFLVCKVKQFQTVVEL